MAVESTLQGIITVTSSELLDVCHQRWWGWKGHPIPCPISFSPLGTFLALLYQQQSSSFHCWSHVEPPGSSSLVPFWQQVNRKKTQGFSCLLFCKGRVSSSFCVFVLFRLKWLSATYTRSALEWKHLHHCLLYTTVTLGIKRIGCRSLTLLPCGGSCCLEVEIIAAHSWFKLLLSLALTPIEKLARNKNMPLPKPQFLFLNKYNFTCSYMCLHAAFAVALGKGDRSWAESIVECSVQALFLWMNSCRAACSSPWSICRVQRLFLANLEKQLLTRSLRRQSSNAQKWCLGHLEAGIIGVWCRGKRISVVYLP